MKAVFSLITLRCLIRARVGLLLPLHSEVELQAGFLCRRTSVNHARDLVVVYFRGSLSMESPGCSK